MQKPEVAPDELRLLEWINVLLSHRWLIVFLGLLFGGVAYGCCKMLRPLYTARATVIANRYAETRSLSRLLGLNFGRSPDEMADVFSTLFLSSYYMELLQSDPLMQKLVDRRWSNGKTLAEMLELKAADEAELRKKALLALRRSVLKIRQNKQTGMLSVECTLPDPMVAAEIANCLVNELQAFLVARRSEGTSELIKDADSRTSEAAMALARADKNLEEFRRRNKTVISAELQTQLEQLQREVKLQEETFIKLKTSADLLRLSERAQQNLIDIIQPAEPPLRKSWPPTAAAAVGAALFGFVLGVTLAFVRHGIWKMSVAGAPGYEEFAAHIRAMNHYLPGVVLLLPRGSRRKPRSAAHPAPSSLAEGSAGESNL
ncbi:MAG: Wzz/FepE/Etk N-terminal domain-containing protein [Candidatus Sumerlaeia bacterium]|nr:Wzz/FepE/Etk N-terminal domain-containing protein [Candidatus Sumerlaeia bacterium]